MAYLTCCVCSRIARWADEYHAKNWRTTKIPDDDLRWEWPFSFDCIHLLDSIHHVRAKTKGELDIYYRNCCYLLVNHGSQWETARLQQIVSGKDSAWIPRSNKYFSVLLPEEPMSWFLHLETEPKFFSLQSVLTLPWVTNFLKCQEKWWQYRKTSIRGLSVNLVPNSWSQHHQNSIPVRRITNEILGLKGLIHLIFCHLFYHIN